MTSHGGTSLLNTSAAISGLFYAFKTTILSWGLGFLVSAFSFSTANDDFRNINNAEALVVRVQTESPAVIAYEEAIRLDLNKANNKANKKKNSEESTHIYDVAGLEISTNDDINIDTLRNISFEDKAITMSGLVITAGAIVQEKAEQDLEGIVIVGFNGGIRKLSPAKISTELEKRTIAANESKRDFKEKAPEVSSVSLVAEKPVALTGSLEFDFGLSLKPKQKIIVYTSHLGQLTDSARVNPKQGTFAITATKGLSGFLVAELQDEFGGVVAEAETMLSGQMARDSIKLTLKKISQGLTVAVNDFADTGYSVNKLNPKYLYVENENISRRLHLSNDGRYKDNDILKGSNAVVSVRYSGAEHSYRPTLSRINAGTKAKIEIFRNSHADIIEKAIGVKSSSGFIFGQVTKKGVPIQGAEVIFADDAISASYFLSDRNIPKLIYDVDKEATVTGAQGYYAAGNALQYSYTAVRVKYQGKLYNAEVVPTRPGFVTYFNFELGTQRNAKAEVKSFLTNQVLGSEVETYGLGINSLSQDIDRLALSYRPGEVLFDVDPGEPYAKFMQSFSQNEKNFVMYALQESFFLDLASQAKVKILANTGIIFGTANSATDIVGAVGDVEDIIYFDRSGNRLSSLPAAGGGFLIYNQPEGQKVVTASCGKKVFTKQILIEARKLHGVHVSCSQDD